jgi:hypothetical protein
LLSNTIEPDFVGNQNSIRRLAENQVASNAEACENGLGCSRSFPSIRLMFQKESLQKYKEETLLL